MNSKDKNIEQIKVLNSLIQELEQTPEVREYLILGQMKEIEIQDLITRWDAYFMQVRNGRDAQLFQIVASEYKSRVSNQIDTDRPYSDRFRSAIEESRLRLQSNAGNVEIPQPSKYDPTWLRGSWNVARYLSLQKTLAKIDPDDSYYNAKDVFNQQ